MEHLAANSPGGQRAPRLLFLAFGFPPAAKSSTYRLREIANAFAVLGWEVTVLNAGNECWANDYGLDFTLLDGVDPRIEVVEVPVRRLDLDNDIRTFTRERALEPVRWIREYAEGGADVFPERIFGWWRAEIETAVMRLQREKGFDLCLFSGTPFVQLAALRQLYEECGVPYAISFHDAWSLNVVNGEESFAPDSEAGAWEARALADALVIWVVNEPIAEYYRQRYPELADRVRVVRNGYDPESVPESPKEGPAVPPLRFGHLGTISFSAEVLVTVLDGWRLARERDPHLRDATFEVRGYSGASYARQSNPISELLRRAEPDGVLTGGPIPKTQLAVQYARWDALVFVVIGGRYMTSGKIYEYMATGLPIMSVHEAIHDASTLLTGYPLWTGPTELDAAAVSAAFSHAARLAIGATSAERRLAQEHASRYERRSQIVPAVAELAATVRP
jgi:hypothetical protein